MNQKYTCIFHQLLHSWFYPDKYYGILASLQKIKTLQENLVATQ